MIKVDAVHTYELPYCIDDFETREEWRVFCDRAKNDKEFLKDLVADNNRHYYNDFSIKKIVKVTCSED